MSDPQQTGAEPEIEAVPVPSAGECLRLGREQAGWTLERLAGELCLPVDRLRALEADEFAGFGGAVFVRGYLRRAAAVLGLPPTALIAGYEAASGMTRPADIVPELPPGRPPRRGMPEWSGRVATVALVVGAIAFTWWYMGPPGTPEPLAEATPPAAEPAQLVLPQVEPEAAPAPQPAAAEVTAEATAGAAAAAVAPAEEVAPESTAQPSLSAAAEPGEQLLSLPTVETDAGAGAAALEMPVTVELRFEFAEDCWVEINDARGTRLAYRLYRAGDVSRLRGVAPVEVFLGNAEGVRLTVDDTPVAVRPAAGRDGTARLTVGGGTG
ncbi:RodZ domain-containing protein [Thioalkalivibrio sp. XN279]|uniref:RodZ domain-containing protein n=1 Tax=Thioalkalivibrio sp. XN279 TaxID=2714953 RepID=UPI00140BF279|nr:RodZ domain-containing protein [Thioalkalivibrio sp. XN279]NHA15626.1 helix-turn-helix domain-containing protein [Thioalkalivibrio sp. XN279]